jgi:hypothetical protein
MQAIAMKFTVSGVLLLAERARALETGVNDHDRSPAEKARAILRAIRFYEVRVRRVSLRAKVSFDDGLHLLHLQR